VVKTSHIVPTLHTSGSETQWILVSASRMKASHLCLQCPVTYCYVYCSIVIDARYHKSPTNCIATLELCWRLHNASPGLLEGTHKH
jgi:hypothetical protein